MHLIASEVRKLLGPNGGIERWGWSLLSVLEVTAPSITMTSTSSAQLMLESDKQAPQWVPFPEVNLHQVPTRSAQQALERMLCSLGRAAAEDGLFAVEWFFGIGKGYADNRATTALWCGSKLLEGISGISLDAEQVPRILPRRRRLEKCARWLAKTLSELWDDENQTAPPDVNTAVEADLTREPYQESQGLGREPRRPLSRLRKVC